MKSKNIAIILMTVGVTIFSSGCWDKIEINKRAIVLSLGIDKNKKAKSDNQKYIISYAFPNPSSSSSGQGGSSSNSGSSGAEYEVSVVGPNFFEANRELTTRMDNHLFYSCAKTIVLGKELLSDKKLFKYSMDVIMRQDQFSKTAVYVGTEGLATDIVKAKPQASSYVGAYISTIVSNNTLSLKTTDGSAMRILKDLNNSGCTFLPRVINGKKDLKVTGCMLIKDYKFAGTLNGNDVKGMLIARGDADRGVYTVNSKDSDFVYEMSKIKTSKDVSLKNGIPHINLKIKTEGSIAQYYSDKTSPGKGKELNKMQNEVSNKIKQNVKTVLNKLQQKFKLDLIGANDYISKHYPKEWEKLRKNWNEVYSKAVINVKVQSSIRRTGLIE